MKKKFLPAFKGVIDGFHDAGILIQYVLGVCAMIAGFILKLSTIEWILFIICIGMVISTEVLNTCIERLCDLYTEEEDERIRKIKDMAAGAVLISSAAAGFSALIILLNHLWKG